MRLALSVPDDRLDLTVHRLEAAAAVDRASIPSADGPSLRSTPTGDGS